MGTVPALSTIDAMQIAAPALRSRSDRLRSAETLTKSGASGMAGKSASNKGSRVPAPPNALQRIIRERMVELNLTYEDVEKRGGPSHSTVYSLLSRTEFRSTPRHETLEKLARGLGLPIDVLRAAAGQSAGFELEGVPTTLDSSKGLRMIAATFEKLDPSRQRTAERVVRALLDEMKNEASGS